MYIHIGYREALTEIFTDVEAVFPAEGKSQKTDRPTKDI